jgi:hypothetical protein
MATFRDRPCMHQFLVDLGDGVTDSPKAGFEVSGIGWRLPSRSTVLATPRKIVS